MCKGEDIYLRLSERSPWKQLTLLLPLPSATSLVLSAAGMSVFEPDIVRHALRNSLCTPDEREKFDAAWDKSVADRISTWTSNGNKSADNDVAKAQIAWSAEVVAYVAFLFSQAKANTGCSQSTRQPPFLKLSVPVLGPRFIPPSFRHIERRSEFPDIDPEAAYLQPLSIVHPFYFPSLSTCPQCRGHNIRWDGWTSTGPRNIVYGIRRPELALGYQLRCKDCKKKRSQLSGGVTKRGKKKQALSYSCATTNPIFWEKWEWWDIPTGEVPIFFKKCAVTRELLDLILEVRLTSTSHGLAENIKQLHLLEYHQVVSEYLECYKRRDCWYKPHILKEFSEPWDEKGYNGKSISGDLITDIILEDSYRTRQDESSEYLRTLKAKSLSIDATFKITQKATVVSKDRQRTDPHKGGLMTAMSETNECVKWKFSMTQSNGELREFLDDLGDRFVQQEEPPPEDVTADNCCHVRSAVVHAFPQAHVGLDVYHFMMRYLVATINQGTNPWRSQVASDIRDALLISGAENGTPAKYRAKEEQAELLQAAYTKWARHGDVWTAAAAKVHADQMRHVRNGCLTRINQDIATDGSRIEGSHKGWNSIMHSHASGLEMLVALGHDHVLRRNIRVALRLDKPTAFVVSTYGSHHTRLVDHTAQEWNALLTLKKRKEPRTYRNAALRPELPKISTKEKFGLVRSAEFETYNGLIKQEEPDEDIALDLLELVKEESTITFQSVGTQLQVDPAFINICYHKAHTFRGITSAELTLAQHSARAHVVPASSAAAQPEIDYDEIEELVSEGSGTQPHSVALVASHDVLDLTQNDDSDDEQPRMPAPVGTRPGLLKRKADPEPLTAGTQVRRKRVQGSTSKQGSQLQVSSPNIVVRGSGVKASQPGAQILVFFGHQKPPSHTGTSMNLASQLTASKKGGATATRPMRVLGQAEPMPAITTNAAVIDPVLLATDTSLVPAVPSEQPPLTAPSPSPPIVPPPSPSPQGAVVATAAQPGSTSLAAPATARQ
ncbi:hypothetical protein EWM64_g9952, partial [Hericium alpestre]